MEEKYNLLQNQIEEILASLADQEGEDFVCQVKPILMKNIERKRLDAFLDGDYDHLEEYIQKVIGKYRTWHNYIYNLQVERDFTQWSMLSVKLTNIAYKYFRRKNFDNSFHTHEIAEECASKAAEVILFASFPYDTDLEAWIVQIVQNKCLKFMSEEMQKRKIPANMQLELDDELECVDDFPDPLSQLEEQEITSAIKEALAQLPAMRREALILKYFDGLSPKEISDKLGKSVDAVYLLQFNGLKELRKILSTNRNIL
jgi:RNA polymerase sigma-70 factor (ECF subfamily)